MNPLVGLVALSVASVVLLYWPTFAWLISEWGSSDSLFEHGYAVALISAVFLILAATKINPGSVRPYWPAVFAVPVATFLWLLSNVADVAAVQSLMLPVLLVLLLVAVLGISAGKILVPPALYILFALPFWELLKPPLRRLTVLVVENILHLTGVPVLVEGSLVHIPAGTFRIASGCSGLNFFVVGIALAALYGYLFYARLVNKAILLGIAAAMALMCNWIRVSAIIAIGNASNMQSGLVHDHRSFGWLIFAVMLVPFFFVAARIGRDDHKPAPLASGNAAPDTIPRKSVVAFVVVLALLSIGPVWAHIVSYKYPPSLVAEVNLPAVNSGWHGPGVSGGEWRPEFQGVSGEAVGSYTSTAGQVWLYQNVYLTQDQDRELVYIHNRIGGKLDVVSTSRSHVSIGDGQPITVHDIVVDDGFNLRRIMFWYEISGWRASGEIKAKIMQAIAVLRGRPEAGVVAVSASCDADCANAGERIQEFMIALGSGLFLNYETKGEES